MLVSILIPCYNSSKWILESIESIQNQTYKNIEILIYNDGSTDNSSDICKKLASHTKNISLISQKNNRGIVYALNHLKNIAQGEYIARMDADDICAPKRIEHQLNWLIENEIDICGTWFTEFGQGLPRTTRWPITHNALSAALLFQNSVCHPTVLAKREVFDNYEYREDFNLAEDYDFFVRAIRKFKFGNTPQPLLRYRRHPTQATQYKKDEMEAVTKKIRLSAIKGAGIDVTESQMETHNMIRSPQSISAIEDLFKIEGWLKHLLTHSDNEEYRSVIASQWMRACIRAAPLGRAMRENFFSSELYDLCNVSTVAKIDMVALSILGINYNSKTFSYLRRLGLSS